MSSVATAKDPATNVRLPREVMDAIDRAARAHGRSRNSEIVVRLRQSLGIETGPAPRGEAA